MTEPKYKPTNETAGLYGKTLYRIVALRDFADVKAGDKGGFIESRKNLSHEGDAWVYESGHVLDDAIVRENAKVYKGHVRGCAIVSGSAKVYGGDIRNSAMVGGNAVIEDWADIYEFARVHGHAKILQHAKVGGTASVWGCAKIKEMASISGSAWITGNTIVKGRASVCGDAWITGDARISSNKDWYSIAPVSICKKAISFFRTLDGWKVNFLDDSCIKSLNQFCKWVNEECSKDKELLYAAQIALEREKQLKKQTQTKQKNN